MTIGTTLPRPDWLPPSVWPFETRTVKIDDCPIAFTDVGTGPTLLFVHTGLWSFVWRDVLVRLSRNFRCICLDAPGNGRSGRPRGGVSLDASARAVAGLIDRLGVREMMLVVHDLGGLAGVVGAARSAGVVTGLAAINAFAWRPERTALRSMLTVVGSRVVRELDVLTGLIPRVTATSFGVGRHLDEASRRAFRARLDHGGVRAFHDYLHDALRSEAIHAEAEASLRGELADVPLITIFGERNDPFHLQRGWRERHRAPVQLVIKHGNHFPMCDDPGYVASAIGDWCREPRPTGPAS